MKSINLYQAKTQLSQLVKYALSGEKIIICKSGKPLLELKPISKNERKLGGWKGKVTISEDFDTLDSELNELFYKNE